MKCVVTYDITSDRKRQKVHNILIGYGTRVQRSVFEALLSKQDYEEMVNEISELIDSDTDSVRIYLLCEKCLNKISIYGNGKKVEELGYIVI